MALLAQVSPLQALFEFHQFGAGPILHAPDGVSPGILKTDHERASAEWPCRPK
jgi:hypothetical protein